MWENLLLFLEKETEGKQNSSIRMEIFQGNGPGRRDPAPEESPLALTASLWMGAVVFSLGIAALGWKGRELLKEALSDGRRVLLPGSGGKPFPGGEIPWVPFAGERLRLLCRKCPTADQEQEDFPEPDKPLAASFSFRKPVPPWEKAREPDGRGQAGGCQGPGPRQADACQGQERRQRLFCSPAGAWPLCSLGLPHRLYSAPAVSIIRSTRRDRAGQLSSRGSRFSSNPAASWVAANSRLSAARSATCI